MGLASSRLASCLCALAAAGNLWGCAAKKEVVRPAPAAAQPPPRIEPPPAITYQEAREAMAAGDFETARRKLASFLAREPKSGAGWFDSGWIAEKLGDPGTAIADYQKSLANQPSHAGAALNLVRLFRVEDRIADASQVARAALVLRPDDARLLDVLASLQRQQGHLDDAGGTIRKVLARHPHDAGAYKNLAAVEADRGHLRLAESALANARKLDDKDAGIVNSLGLLAMRRDDPTAARGFFDEATRVDPGLPAPWANLGALALQYRDYSAAQQAYAKALALGLSRWDIHLAHAWALEGLKHPAEARAGYDKVLALRPQQADALFGRANALKSEGDLPAALEAFKAYAQLPGAAKLKEAQAQMASIDLRLRNPPQAAKPAAGTDPGPAAAQHPSDPKERAPVPAPAPAPPPSSVPRASEKSPEGNAKKPSVAVPAGAKMQR